MPSRSTILTGQHPSTHGVFMNGVPLPPDAPSVAEVLRASGYRTALVGKAHFEPYFDPFLRFEENLLSTTGTTPHGGSRRGFEHLETASHGAMGPLHYAQWLVHNHPEALGMYCRAIDDNLQVSAEAGGDTGAPQVKVNPIDRGIYHTDWVADRTIDWLDTLDADDDWFCWMSFPDPHHPWDPPESEVGRVDWREVPLPAGYPEDRATGRRSSTPSPATGGPGTTDRSCPTTRRRPTGCRPPSPRTRSARSTPATPSRSSSSTRPSPGARPGGRAGLG